MRRFSAFAGAGVSVALALTVLARAEPPASSDAGSAAAAAVATDDEALMSVEQAPVEDAAITLARVLGEPRYAFCHDEERPATDSYESCQYAPDHVPACPAFATACARARAEAAPHDEHAGFSLDLGPGLAMVARVVFWTLLAAAVAWWLVTVGKHLYDGRSTEEPEGEPMAPLPAFADEEGPRSGRVVDKDALLLLARSRKALASGDLRATARLAHAALVRALEAAGHLHVDRSSTNGDYERALRHLPELRGTFREVAGEVERSEFGQAPPGPDRLAQILSRVEPIVRGVVMVALFVTALSLSACQKVNRGERPEDAPDGDSVFRALLEHRGAMIERRSNPVEKLPEETTDTVVVMSSAPLSHSDWRTLLDWGEQGGALVVVGTPPDLPDAFGVKKPERRVCVDKPSAALMGSEFEASKVVFHGAPLALASEWVPMVACGGLPVIAAHPLGDAGGSILLLGDARFLSNASLATADHAKLLLFLMGQPEVVSVIDRRIRAGADSPYRAMARSGLLPALIQGLVLMLLVALARGASFGVRHELVLPPRRAFAEHVRAVARLYARAGASRHALGAYAAWALDRLNARLGRAGANRVLDSAALIAQTTGREEGAVTRILAEAADARERPGLASSPAEDHATYVALDELVRNTGGIK